MPCTTGARVFRRENYEVMRSTALLAAGLMLCCHSLAQAHSQSSSRLTLELVEGVPQALTLHMTLLDLLHLVDLDSNDDGQLTWGEVSASEPEVLDLILSNVLLRAGGSSCTLRGKQQVFSLTTHAEAPALRVALQVHCPKAAEASNFHLRYQLFFDDDPTHKALLSVTGDAGAETHLLTTDTRELELPGASVVPSAQAPSETPLHAD